MTEQWTDRLDELLMREHSNAQDVPAPWAGALIALGAAAARRRANNGWQLVVAVSVPLRDYAALLVACGWLLAQPEIGTPDVVADAAQISSGTPVRMATTQFLVADRFHGLDSARSEPRFHIGGSWWKASLVKAIRPDDVLDDRRFKRMPMAPPGDLATLAQQAASWHARWCTPSMDVAVIGTQTRLAAELSAVAGLHSRGAGYDRLGDVLRPDDGTSPSWASIILPGGKEDPPPIPAETSLAVLDGSTGIRWLSEISTPVVVAVLDRSSDDESPGEIVLQRRASGREVPLRELGWKPGPGMEALAFEVRS